MHKYNNYFSYFLVFNVVVWYIFTSLMDILFLGNKSLPVWIFSHWFPITPSTHLSEQDSGSNKGLHTWVSSRSFNKNHYKKRTEQSLTKHSLIKHSLVNLFICLWIHMFTCLYISLSTHPSIDFNDMSITLSFICYLLLHSFIHLFIKYTWFVLWHTSPITINDIITKQ